MIWLPTALVATAVSSLVLTGVYGYLYAVHRERALGIWTASWAIYGLRFLAQLAAVAWAPSAALQSLSQGASVASAVLLFVGAAVFVGRSVPRWWLIVAGAVFAWTVTAPALDLDFAQETLPAYLLEAAIYVWVGVLLLRQLPYGGIGRRVAAFTFILWGIHKADYPLLRPLEWFAPWGYLLGAALAFVSALGILLVYFERVREALARSERRFRMLAEQAADPWYLCDADAILLEANDAAADALGYTREEFRGMPVSQVSMAFPDEQARHLLAGIAASGPATLIDRHRRKDGTEYPVEVRIGAIGTDRERRFLGVARDLSERERLEADRARLEEQFWHVQKMESIGTLAGGIAHDFNNLLAAMLGFAEMTRDLVDDGSEAQENIDEILSAGVRARDLVRQILAFSHSGTQAREPIDVGMIVKEGLRFLRASVPKVVEIAAEIAPGCGSVSGNPTQLQQVFLNLCTNAVQAMEGRGGVLAVELAPEELDAARAGALGLNSGPYVRLSVSDTGVGMSAEVAARVFEPYFTTKERGKGTGLGLAVVHGIVRSHDGSVGVESAVDRGSTFHVYLPATGATTTAARVVEAPPAGDGERVLVVDDEPMLLRVAQRALRSLGYRVDTAESAPAARQRILDDPSYEVVVTDLNMPGETGLDLARSLGARLPSPPPFVLVTGYPNEVTSDELRAVGVVQLVVKPFDRFELARAVRDALDGRENPADEST